MFFKSIRKEILINPSFQLKILASFLIPAVVILIIKYYFFLEMISNAEVIFLENGGFSGRQVMALKKLFEEFSFVYILLTSVLVFLIFVTGILISFRIAGPAYHLKKHFSENDLNDMKEIKLRKHDMLQDVAKAFNDNIAKNKKKNS